MTSKEKLIANYDPKNLALAARRGPVIVWEGENLPYPITWSEKRVGGGVEITSAKWNFKGYSEEQIDSILKSFEMQQKLFKAYAGKSFFEICEMFKPKEIDDKQMETEGDSEV